MMAKRNTYENNGHGKCHARDKLGDITETSAHGHLRGLKGALPWDFYLATRILKRRVMSFMNYAHCEFRSCVAHYYNYV